MFRPQKSRNESHSVVVWPENPAPRREGQPGKTAAKNVWSASPPIQVWMPNQPHATRARMSAGRFEPAVPYAARANTGKGMPYFVPGCEFRRIGDEHDRVAEEDREERLLPVHPAVHEARGQHVRRDAVRHRDPQRRVVVRRPGASGDRNRGEILVVERARRERGRVRQLDAAVRVGDLAGHRAHGVPES